MSERLIDTPDYAHIRDSFAQELSAAAGGAESSLPFIRNSLPERSLVRSSEIVQAFVIGGTNGTVATAEAGDGQNFSVVTQREFAPLPTFATVESLTTFVGEHLDPRTEAIGMNFAYNLIPVVGEHGELDGIMNQGNTKGHAFEGLLDEQVGRTVSSVLKEATGRDITVSVANDTVCLITSGLAEDTDRNTLFAAIAGTGYNIALFFDKQTAVNLQASDFTGFQQTESGLLVDQQSNNRGEQIYNKEVAAGELYKHFNVLVPALSLSANTLHSSEELAELARSGNSKEAVVARQLLERSACLVAAQFAGIYIFKDEPAQMTGIAQGSLFWKVPGYQETVQRQLLELGVPQGTIQLRRVDNSDVLGAMKLLSA